MKKLMQGRSALWTSHVMIGVLVISGLWDSAIAEMPGGIGSYQTGGTFHSRGIEVVVPETYKVLDTRCGSGRLLITALEVPADFATVREFRSEVWLFTNFPSRAARRTFEDRKVLVAVDSTTGEQQRWCAETVNCPQATAVYIQAWEGGTTRLFDSHGREIPLDWLAATRVRYGFLPDRVRPLAWVSYRDEAGHSYRLVCEFHETGSQGSYFATYDLRDGAIDLFSATDCSADFLRDVIRDCGRWIISS